MLCFIVLCCRLFLFSLCRIHTQSHILHSKIGPLSFFSLSLERLLWIHFGRIQTRWRHEIYFSGFEALLIEHRPLYICNTAYTNTTHTQHWHCSLYYCVGRARVNELLMRDCFGLAGAIYSKSKFPSTSCSWTPRKIVCNNRSNSCAVNHSTARWSSLNSSAQNLYRWWLGCYHAREETE